MEYLKFDLEKMILKNSSLEICYTVISLYPRTQSDLLSHCRSFLYQLEYHSSCLVSLELPLKEKVEQVTIYVVGVTWFQKTIGVY